MGKYDDITPEKLRSELLRFARLITKMEEEGVLLEKTPSVLRLLGELRQMLFAHEVRYTKKLLPPEKAAEDKEKPVERADPGLEDSRRIVEEALRREKELQEELEKRLFRRNNPDTD
jgi:hypothetical protein